MAEIQSQKYLFFAPLRTRAFASKTSMVDLDVTVRRKAIDAKAQGR